MPGDSRIPRYHECQAIVNVTYGASHRGTQGAARVEVSGPFRDGFLANSMRRTNSYRTSGPVPLKAVPGCAPFSIQAKRKTRGIQPREPGSNFAPMWLRTREKLSGRGTGSAWRVLGSAQWRGSEVTRYSRQISGRMGWMEQDSSCRNGKGTPW